MLNDIDIFAKVHNKAITDVVNWETWFFYERKQSKGEQRKKENVSQWLSLQEFVSSANNFKDLMLLYSAAL